MWKIRYGVSAVFAFTSLTANAFTDATTVTSISQGCYSGYIGGCSSVAGYADVGAISPTNTRVNGLNTAGTGATAATGVGNNVGATTITGGTNNLGAAAPALTISGQNGSTAPNTSVGAYPLVPSGAGVLITGAGSAGGPDVYIASQNGNAAISVTNTGVRIISPAGTNPSSPINVSSTNTYGVAGANNTGAVTNNFGTGGTGTSGAGGITQVTTNNIGLGGGANSQVNNTFGNGSSSSTGLVSNTIGQSVYGGGTVTNSFGGGTGTSNNSIGVGGLSTTTIGSTTVGSSVLNQAGYTSSTMSNGVSTTSVQSGGGVGGSVLNGGSTTSANSGAVLSGGTGTYATVDVNGKITMVTGTATQSSTNMTLTNGLGNTHGIVVNEQQATISGGATSSSMTLNDNGATFSNPANGKPIQVHGVADGTTNFDAVNVQQLNSVKQGIAGVAAMSNIPALAADKQFNLGVGVGGFDGQGSFAVGATARLTENLTTKASFSHAFGSNNSNINDTTWGVGAALSW